jgi:hypothetical protein
MLMKTLDTLEYERHTNSLLVAGDSTASLSVGG